MRKLTTEEWIIKAKLKHKDSYDYSSVIYNNARINVDIKCKKHNKIFNQNPFEHLKGRGCPLCGNERTGDSCRITQDQFLEKANQIHGNKYDYSESIFLNVRTKVKIKCKKHGLFIQRPQDHLYGAGCPECRISKGEERIREYLSLKKIEYKSSFKFEDCRNIFPLPFDFYLADHNLCIEYDGAQHYKAVSYWGGEEGFRIVKLRDSIKNQYCIDKKIKLLRIPYWDFQNIEKIIEEIINNG